MPLVYADTSALFAYLHPDDEFSVAVDTAVQKASPDFVYWPFLRFELRHNLRRTRTDADGEVAWRTLRVAEKTARLRWQEELTADKVLDAAEELSAETAQRTDCGSGDYLHVAAARRLSLVSGVDEFWTCDGAQAALARNADLPTRLFKSTRSSRARNVTPGKPKTRKLRTPKD